MLLERCKGDINKIEDVLSNQCDIKIKEKSVIQLFKENDSECHYCSDLSKNRQVSYGIEAERLNVIDYQNLLDKGWRRSGSWVYHPSNDKSCCPSYTVSCTYLTEF